MSSSSTIFSGSSRYSSDFATWAQRAVNIRSLQLSQMQNQQNTLSSRQSALSSLDTKVAALQTALENVSTSLGTGSFSVANSDNTTVAAKLGDGAHEGSYQIEVTSLGTYASATSLASGGVINKVTDPATGSISGSTSFSLYVDGSSTPITITPEKNTLDSLVEAINNSSAGVKATTVNLGGYAGADYRLTLQSSSLGAHTYSLKDNSGNALLSTSAAGTYATYKVNGGAEIQASTRSITLSSGLTVDMLKQSATGTPVTLNVTRSSTSIGNALSSFVNAFNAVVGELDNNRGSGGGALNGDSVLTVVTGIMRQLSSYEGSSTLKTLADIGIELGQDGKLTYDSAVFSSATAGDFNSLSQFLGNSDGSGFLAIAANSLTGLEDTDNGILKLGLASLKTQISDQTQRISDEQDRIDQYQTFMQQQMSAADALIASMEQQVTYFTGMFEAMRNSGN